MATGRGWADRGTPGGFCPTGGQVLAVREHVSFYFSFALVVGSWCQHAAEQSALRSGGAPVPLGPLRMGPPLRAMTCVLLSP